MLSVGEVVEHTPVEEPGTAVEATAATTQVTAAVEPAPAPVDEPVTASR